MTRVLRPPRAPLIGREIETSRLAAGLGAGLTTLIGPGGVGKTSLALATVDVVRPRFGDVWICELAGVAAADAVDDAVADSIGAFRNHDASAMAAMASALHGRRALLVLDNVEQVISSVGRLVTGLLALCPELAILATSREALRTASEVVMVVPPLDVEQHAPMLFRRQATRASPRIDLETEHENILAICRDLDGLPLALELAAARLATMSIDDVRERLDSRFGLLPGGAENHRHATIAGAIEWSYDLLEPHERGLFDRLSVFQGGFDIEGAMSLMGAARNSRTAHDVAAVLNSLADKSMLVRSDTRAGPRWEMLESLRHFGDRQLSERGERSSIRNAHLDWMLDVASQASAACHGDNWDEGAERFRAEWDNLRAAIDWAIGTQRARDVDRLLRDVFLMARWTLETEPSIWAARAIERGQMTGAIAGAPAHLHVAFGEFLAGSHESALHANLRAIEMDSTPSDREWAHHYAAVELLYLGRTAEAVAMADFAVTDPSARPVERVMQQSAHAVFKFFAGQMDAPDADRAIAAAIEVARSTNNPLAQGHAAYNGAMIASITGRADEAANGFAIAMTLGRTHGVPNLVGYVLMAQLYTPGAPGLESAREVLDWWRDHRDVGNEFVLIEATGINLVETGRVEDGGLLLGHIGSEERRVASMVARRDDAIRTVRSGRRGRAAFIRGASMRRPELLDHARTAVIAALER